MKAALSKGVTLTKIEGKDVLFSMRSGDTFGLNETAAFFVRELLKSDFEAALVASAGEYDAPADELRTDMTDLVRDLVTAKLLETRS